MDKLQPLHMVMISALGTLGGCQGGGEDTDTSTSTATSTSTDTSNSSSSGSNSDASTTEVLTGTTDDGSSTDVNPTSDSETDTGVIDEPCALEAPQGAGETDLVVELCEVEGEPLRVEEGPFDRYIGGLTMGIGGEMYVNLEHQPTIRLVDDDAPGCLLTRVASDDLPEPPESSGSWGVIEAFPNGVVYEVSPWTGTNNFRWFGSETGECWVNGGTNHLLGFDGAGHAISGDFPFFYPTLFDLNTCSAQEYSAIPVDQARSAMFFDGDVITTDYWGVLKRWTIDGELVWEGPDDHYWESMMVRCGDDICMGVGIEKPQLGTLYRYSGVDGHRIEKYSYKDLFGLTSQSETFGSSADHKSILVPITMSNSDPECSDKRNVAIYRVSGF